MQTFVPCSMIQTMQYELLNAIQERNSLAFIHSFSPSDSRMHSWGPVTYTVGQQAIGYFPMAIFKAIGPVTIRFALASGQGGARTLYIGTTLAFAGARPVVTVNTWTSSTPAAPNQPDSRGVTRGTWRGNVSQEYLMRARSVTDIRWVSEHHVHI